MERRRGDGDSKNRPAGKSHVEQLPDDDEDEDTATDDERGVKRPVVSLVRKADAAGAGGPACQAHKCSADLSAAKRYHRRHKVCAYHAKAPIVVVAGLDQRFCQQCSRFHELWAFDQTKRSCRRRLAGHNERRRKSSLLETDEESSEQKAGGGSSSEHGWGRRQGPGTSPKHFQIR